MGHCYTDIPRYNLGEISNFSTHTTCTDPRVQTPITAPEKRIRRAGRPWRDRGPPPGPAGAARGHLRAANGSRRRQSRAAGPQGPWGEYAAPARRHPGGRGGRRGRGMGAAHAAHAAGVGGSRSFERPRVPLRHECRRGTLSVPRDVAGRGRPSERGRGPAKAVRHRSVAGVSLHGWSDPRVPQKHDPKERKALADWK